MQTQTVYSCGDELVAFAGNNTIYSIQWSLSIVDTLGTADNVLISEVSSFQGEVCTQLYPVGVVDQCLD